MKTFRQYDFHTVRLGTCGNISIKTSGCFITSLAMLAEKDPVEVNALFAENGVYSDCNMLANKERAAELLGLKYAGVVYTSEEAKKKAKDGCTLVIAETVNTTVPQHFFVYDLSNGEINDPISKTRGFEKNKYKIKSFRLFFGKREEGETKAETKATKEFILPKISKEDSLAKNLENTLLVAKNIWNEGEKTENEFIKTAAAQIGQLVREMQSDIGAKISE